MANQNYANAYNQIRVFKGNVKSGDVRGWVDHVAHVTVQFNLDNQQAVAVAMARCEGKALRWMIDRHVGDFETEQFAVRMRAFVAFIRGADFGEKATKSLLQLKKRKKESTESFTERFEEKRLLCQQGGLQMPEAAVVSFYLHAFPKKICARATMTYPTTISAAKRAVMDAQRLFSRSGKASSSEESGSSSGSGGSSSESGAEDVEAEDEEVEEPNKRKRKREAKKIKKKVKKDGAPEGALEKALGALQSMAEVHKRQAGVFPRGRVAGVNLVAGGGAGAYDDDDRYAEINALGPAAAMGTDAERQVADLRAQVAVLTSLATSPGQHGGGGFGGGGGGGSNGGYQGGRSGGGRGNYFGAPRNCYNCGQEGHISLHCRNAKQVVEWCRACPEDYRHRTVECRKNAQGGGVMSKK